MVHGMPGIGGSLGRCQICGKDFLVEVLMNTPVHSIGVDGIEGDFIVHKECRDIVNRLPPGKDNWKLLPDGPIKAAFTRANADAAEALDSTTTAVVQ